MTEFPPRATYNRQQILPIYGEKTEIALVSGGKNLLIEFFKTSSYLFWYDIET